jgi:hypothetical protein
VILGVLLEGPELVWEVREVFRQRGFPDNTEPPTPILERHTPAWIISISLAGWFLVCLGVAGEGIFEGYVSAADSLLQTFNNTLLSDTSNRASNAEITAKAFESQIADANARAAEANRLAGQEKLARLKIEERLADRHLTLDQRKQMLAVLRGLPGTRVMVTYLFNADADAQECATEIGNVFRDIPGWTLAAPLPAFPQTSLCTASRYRRRTIQHPKSRVSKMRSP